MTMQSEGLSQSSVEAKQTSKGDYQVNAKVYQNADNTIDLPTTLADTITRCQDELTQRGHSIVGG